MKYKTIIKMMMVTMGAMFAANFLSSMNPMARKLFKGSPVIGVNNGNNKAAWWGI